MNTQDEMVVAEILFTFVIFFAIAAVGFLAYRQSSKRARDLDDTYRRVADSLGGRSDPGGFLGQPSLTFSFEGGRAAIDIYSTGGKHAKYYTQLHFAWPDGQLRCEVTPVRLLSSIGKMLGMQDIQIGSPEFDPRYLISGNSNNDIRRLLSPQVQLTIDALRKFLGNDDISVSIRGSRLLIKKRTLIRHEASLKRFIKLGINLHDAASDTNAEGIEFVRGEQQDAVLSLAFAICQICGDEIVNDVVFCRSCKTPHHRDCWLYYGSCSTYGCGQVRFMVSKKRQGSSRRVVKRPR